MKLILLRSLSSLVAMRSPSWFAKFWKRVSTGVVQDVPADLEACEDCREIECTQERWQTCPRRLAAEAAVVEARLGGAEPERAPDKPAAVAPAESQTDLAAKPKPAPS
jgi:hypothetical protein